MFTAILAMDAYNRGYRAQINIGETSIGDAKIVENDGDDAAQAVGFYAVAYSWNGQTVISFQGTDNPSFLSSTSDVWNGWLGGAGIMTPQG